MNRALALGICLALFPGCSLIGMQPVSRPVPRYTYPQCSETLSLVAADLVLAVAGGLVTTSLTYSSTEKAYVFALGLSSAAFLGSFLYGIEVRSRCAAARREAEKAFHPTSSPPLPTKNAHTIPTTWE